MSGQHPNPHHSPETRANEPLPAIPDGGLAQAMPDWLRDGPPAPVQPSVGGDPMGFITADDLPVWLRHLSPDGETPVPPRPETPIAPRPETPIARAAVEPGSAPPMPPRTDIPATAPSPKPPAPMRPPATTPTPPGRLEPQPRDRRALVTVIGFVVLALGVLAYLYAKGVL